MVQPSQSEKTQGARGREGTRGDRSGEREGELGDSLNICTPNPSHPRLVELQGTYHVSLPLHIHSLRPSPLCQDPSSINRKSLVCPPDITASLPYLALCFSQQNPRLCVVISIYPLSPEPLCFPSPLHQTCDSSRFPPKQRLYRGGSNQNRRLKRSSRPSLHLEP